MMILFTKVATMSKDIWHFPSEAPAYCFLCVFENSFDGEVHCGHYNPVKKQFCSTEGRYEINQVKKYCDLLHLLDCEQELILKRKALEQSEICCTEWEKQALDYKAENIALSGELERTRKALEITKNAINSAVDHNIINCVVRGIDPRTDDTNVTLCNALEQITALEQKDK